MKTTYDNLIEECAIEENYGVEFNKKTWNKMEKLITSLTKEFNLRRT